ncbi:MAG TPA: M13 family metallopeptidase N-terminal domain-containing protein, partial [Sphingomonas sp.]|nr:M13 family metallopeptidase N-terminal domain-containing protein [Sphingomonas sp.]
MRLPAIALLASTMLAGAAVAAQPADFLQAVPNGAAPAVAGKPTYGSFGFDEKGMDKSIVPGNDFYDYANGDWMKTTQIPADRASYGMFHKLQDLSLERTRSILEESEKQPGSKIGAFYASFMDEAAADKKGIAPIKPWLAEISAIKDKPALAAELARLGRMGVPDLFTTYIAPDDKNPSAYIAQFAQGGLGLPDRDYYLKDDPKLAKIRTEYVAYLARL